MWRKEDLREELGTTCGMLRMQPGALEYIHQYINASRLGTRSYLVSGAENVTLLTAWGPLPCMFRLEYKEHASSSEKGEGAR